MQRQLTSGPLSVAEGGEGVLPVAGDLFRRVSPGLLDPGGLAEGEARAYEDLSTWHSAGKVTAMAPHTNRKRPDVTHTHTQTSHAQISFPDTYRHQQSLVGSVPQAPWSHIASFIAWTGVTSG